MIRMDLLTEITGWPVGVATRAAVRCRVPDSSVGIVGCGTRCTAARTMLRLLSPSTIAPSILASSRSRVAENSTSNSKPPVHRASTVGSSPRTIKAPVLPRRMRSSPSRSAVPGATAARAALRRSSLLLSVPPLSVPLSIAGTRPPEVASAGKSSGAAADIRPVHRARPDIRAPMATRHLPSQRDRDGFPDVSDLFDGHEALEVVRPRLRARSGQLPGPGRHDRDAEPEPLGLGQPPLHARHPARLARQPDLADDHDARGPLPVVHRTPDGHRRRQIVPLPRPPPAA